MSSSCALVSELGRCRPRQKGNNAKVALQRVRAGVVPDEMMATSYVNDLLSRITSLGILAWTAGSTSGIHLDHSSARASSLANALMDVAMAAVY